MMPSCSANESCVKPIAARRRSSPLCRVAILIPRSVDRRLTPLVCGKRSVTDIPAREERQTPGCTSAVSNQHHPIVLIAVQLAFMQGNGMTPHLRHIVAPQSPWSAMRADDLVDFVARSHTETTNQTRPPADYANSRIASPTSRYVIGLECPARPMIRKIRNTP